MTRVLLAPDKFKGSLTAAEVADALQVHRKTVLRYVAARRLTPTQKLPGTTGAFLFRRQDVEALRSRLGAA